MKKYYLVEATTQYDGFEFSHNGRYFRGIALTQSEAEKFAREMFLHEDSGEELADVRFREITKEEYNILDKLGI
jgi:hypothetical protein